MKQLHLDFGGDPVATLASYLGPSRLVLEDAACNFLCSGRISYCQTDVPEHVLVEAAAAIWTADELTELRSLQAVRTAICLPDGDRIENERAWLDYDAAWNAAYKTESLCRARLIRRVSPRWASYWEGGWW